MNDDCGCDCDCDGVDVEHVSNLSEQYSLLLLYNRVFDNTHFSTLVVVETVILAVGEIEFGKFLLQSTIEFQTLHWTDKRSSCSRATTCNGRGRFL